MNKFSDPGHPIWTIITIVCVGGFIIGTLIVTTSKWDSEILIALAAIGGPLVVDYLRHKWGLKPPQPEGEDRDHKPDEEATN